MGSKGSGTRTKSRRPLLGSGIGIAMLGALLLLAPFVIPDGRVAGIFAGGVRIPAMVVLLIGAVLIGLDFVFRVRATPPPATTVRQDPNWTSWAPPETLAALQRAIPQPGPISTFADTEGGETDVAPLPAAPQRRRQLAWNQKVFDGIEWRRFEAVCEKLFGQAGFETLTQSHGADGGVDIWLHSKHAQGPAAVVRCKHWSGKQVGVKELREFLGVMAAKTLKRGTYATTSTFTGEAAKFAKENGINALDGAKLLALIAKRTPEQQRELLAIAYAGKY